MTTRLRRVRQDETHRLIPTRYSDESVLARLAEPDEPLDVLFELDSAVILVAHDRWFLEAVGTSVLELEAGR